ncbi:MULTISPECIES: MarR family transcriptional regulator [Ramlibacter]|uniref:MarR family transcriptional regulator n=1 Tax=Ramlibacter aquaticus TaxID=2780094 RepID=A0ABR9SBZ4_9BURK|nr:MULTISPECIES: MarR family transcriptional regulator [Ramlibacter]MBE7939867.1 MarR family transcriptional regulator [Ramlibacter aquaticus]
MKKPLTRRFGFLVNEVGRLYSQQFDRLARERLGLSQAQCRLLFALSAAGEPLPQSALAQRLGVTPMAIASLCDRMAAAGWVERQPCEGDRRVNLLALRPRAARALDGALKIGDELTREVLGGLDAASQAQLLDMLGSVRDRLTGEAAP